MKILKKRITTIFLLFLCLVITVKSADRNSVRDLINSPYNKNLFNQTYKTMKNRVEWDGYARTALEASYPDMYSRDAGNQILAHIGEGDLEDARDMLFYYIRYSRALNLQYVPHHIPKVDRESNTWPYGNATNRSCYSQPDTPDMIAQINSSRFRAAQTVVPAISGSLQGVEIYLDIEYKSPGTVYLSVQRDLQGNNVLGISQVSTQKLGKPPLQTPAGSGWLRFEFLPPVSLSAGNTYYIVVSAPDVIPLLRWCGKKNATGGIWKPSYVYDSNSGGWSGPNTADIFSFVLDDKEGKYRNYPSPSTAQEADANYIFIKAWTEYIKASKDTLFRDYTYDVIKRFTDYYLGTSYFNSTFNLIRNPWLECPKVHSGNVYDIFTNCYAAMALKDMSEIAQQMGNTSDAQRWNNYYLLISSGINTTLAGTSQYNGKPVYYELISGNENNKLYQGFSSWSLGPIPAEWDKVDSVRFKNTYELFKATGSFMWSGIGSDTGKNYLMLCHVSPQSDPVSGEGVTVMVRTEAYAWEIYYNAQIADYNRITELFDFIQYYNRDPDNPVSQDIIPEAMGYERYLTNQTWAWNRGNQIMAANYVWMVRKTKNILYPPVRIECIAEPSSMVADNVSISTITAIIKNELGEVIYNSTATVTFNITGPGTLIGENPVKVNYGRCSIKVKSGATPGLITVTANSSGLSSGYVNINTYSYSPPLKILLTVSPETIRADGNSISIVKAYIQDTNGNTVNTATNTVTFSITGPGYIQGTNPAIPVDGIASVNIVSSLVSGTITVSAISGGLTSANKNIYSIPWSALSFDGTNDYVNIPASPSLNFSGNQITIEAWFRNLSPGDWNNRFIAGRDGGFGIWAYGWPEYHFCLNIGGTTHDLQININNQAKTEWTHIAGTYDGQTMRFYYNGTCQRMKTVSGNLNVNSSALWHIGGNSSGGSYFWGHIDEVRISNIARYTSNFIVPEEPFTVDSNTAGLWHLDEGTGTTIKDSSPNNNNGTISGAVWVPGCSFPQKTTIQSIPSRILITSDKTALPPDGSSTANITATVVDEMGYIVISSTATITFSLSGSGSLVGTNPVNAVNGIANIVYRAGNTSQTVRITATSQGLTGGSIDIVLSTQTQPSITVLLPDGGESWTAGTVQTVTWTWSQTVGNVNIDLSTDSGLSWTNLVQNIINDGLQTVTVPDTPSDSCLIRVSETDGSPSDTSNGVFRIISTQQQEPVLYVSTATIEFGEVKIGDTATMDFEITNKGEGTLTGNITTENDWISVSPESFRLSKNISQAIYVTVDNEVLNQRYGQYTGKVKIDSNGGSAEIEIILTATCVLTKPNPYNPERGLLKFFGSGIVPGQTEIKIWTLSGELVNRLEGKFNEIVWDGRNEKGDIVIPGIYIYTYESPKEKGVGKFTIR